MKIKTGDEQIQRISLFSKISSVKKYLIVNGKRLQETPNNPQKQIGQRTALYKKYRISAYSQSHRPCRVILVKVAELPLRGSDRRVSRFLCTKYIAPCTKLPIEGQQGRAGVPDLEQNSLAKTRCLVRVGRPSTTNMYLSFVPEFAVSSEQRKIFLILADAMFQVIFHVSLIFEYINIFD